MENFVSALKKAIDNENWYGALLIALTIPDICGKIESPKEKSGTRYCSWVKKYLEPKYTFWIGTHDQGHKHIFLSATDCYALRCAYLHEGSDDITEQAARESLNRFLFVLPRKTEPLHCNQSGQVLQLQIDIFCQDMVAAIEQWMEDKKNDQNIQKRMDDLLKMYLPWRLRF